MKTPPINRQVAEETLNLPTQNGRPGTAVQPQSNQIELDGTSSSEFADKIRALQAYSRQARFILHCRRRGKIARLPEPIREHINLMLRDGLPYQAIIDRLGEAGKHLNKDNLSRWRKADHQDWLANQTWLRISANCPETLPGIQDLVFLLYEMDSDTLQATVARSRNAFVRICNFAARATALSAQSSQAPMPQGLPQAQDHRSGAADPRESNQIAPIRTNSHQIAPDRTNSRIKCRPHDRPSARERSQTGTAVTKSVSVHHR